MEPETSSTLSNFIIVCIIIGLCYFAFKNDRVANFFRNAWRGFFALVVVWGTSDGKFLSRKWMREDAEKELKKLKLSKKEEEELREKLYAEIDEHIEKEWR